MPTPVRVSTPPRPIASGPDPLRERPLGDQLDLELAGDHLGLGLRVGPDVRGDQAFDPPAGDQLADADTGKRGVVGDDRERLSARQSTRPWIRR